MNLRHFIGLLFFLLLLIVAGCTFKASTYGLRPEYPENRFCGPYKCATPEIVFTEVDSLQPTLKWEAFPRPHDAKEDKHGMLSRINDVTYDLKIWSSENEFPALIYSRQGLPEPFHKIEHPLKACAKYFWSIRASFKIDKETRVTEWGISTIPAGWAVRRSSTVPNPNLYRFKTPCTSIDEKQTELDK